MRRIVVGLFVLTFLASCSNEEAVPQPLVEPEVVDVMLEGQLLVVPFSGYEDQLEQAFTSFELSTSLPADAVTRYQTIVVFDDGSLDVSSLALAPNEVLDVTYFSDDSQERYLINVRDTDVIPVVMNSLPDNDFTQTTSFQLRLRQQGTLFVVEDRRTQAALELQSYLTEEDILTTNLRLADAYQYEQVVVIEETRSVDLIPGRPAPNELVVDAINYGVQTQKLRITEYRNNWQQSISLLMTNLYTFNRPQIIDYSPVTRLLIGREQITPDTTPCRLPDADDAIDITTGFDIPTARIPRAGNVTAKVIYVDFSDYRLDWTPEQLEDYIQDQTEYATAFYQDMSKGQMQLNFDLHPSVISLTGSVDSYRLSAAEATAGMVDMIDEAIEVADPEVDFSSTDFIVLVINPNVPYEEANVSPAFPYDEDFPFRTDEKDIYNATVLARNIEDWTYPAVLTHEMGHLLGLVDLYDYTYQENYDDIHRFVGGFDIMGFIDGDYHELMGWNRFLLGWFNDSDVHCLPLSNLNGVEVQMELGQFDLSSAKPMVVIPYSNTQAIVIEAKTDSAYCEDCEGILVYQIDTSVASGNGSIIVIPASGSNDPYYRQGLFELNEVITVNGITIEIIENLTDAIIVSVQAN